MSAKVNHATETVLNDSLTIHAPSNTQKKTRPDQIQISALLKKLRLIGSLQLVARQITNSTWTAEKNVAKL